jgi:hypothetical protein
MPKRTDSSDSPAQDSTLWSAPPSTPWESPGDNMVPDHPAFLELAQTMYAALPPDRQKEVRRLCGGEVGMSAGLQSRNVRLVAALGVEQARSERLIPVARSDRGG